MDRILLAVGLFCAIYIVVSEIYVRLQGVLFVKKMEQALTEDAQSY